MKRIMAKWLVALMMVGAVGVSAPVQAADEVQKVTGKTEFTATSNDTGDNKVTKVVQIGNAKVKVVLNGGDAYIVVLEGTLDMTYADGSPMCSLSAGSGMKVTGFIGSGSGVTLDLKNGKPTLALAPAVNPTIGLGNTGKAVEITSHNGTKTKIEPGKTATVEAPYVNLGDGEVNLAPGAIGKFNKGGVDLVAFGKANGKTGLANAVKDSSSELSDLGQDINNDDVLEFDAGKLVIKGNQIATKEFFDIPKHLRIGGHNRTLQTPKFNATSTTGAFFDWSVAGVDRDELSNSGS